MEDGDTAAAKAELESAYSWAIPAYEDTEAGSQREALDRFSIAVGDALANFETEQGRQALDDAQDACA